MIQDASALFIVVVIGYVLLSRSNYYRHRLLANSRHAILYESAFAGGVLFFVVFLVLEMIKQEVFDCSSVPVEGLEDLLCPFDRVSPIPFLDVLLACGLIALLGIGVGNLQLTERKLGERIARKSGLIANVVLDALDEHHLVQITTTRGKVYVGWIFLGPGISREGKVEDVAVAPLVSGHRDPITQVVALDIDYSIALDEYAGLVRLVKGVDAMQSQRQPEMSVVIPMGEIALIRRYNEELVESFVSISDDADD